MSKDFRTRAAEKNDKLYLIQQRIQDWVKVQWDNGVFDKPTWSGEDEVTSSIMGYVRGYHLQQRAVRKEVFSLTHSMIGGDFYVCPAHTKTHGYESCCSCGDWEVGDVDYGRECTEAKKYE